MLQIIVAVLIISSINGEVLTLEIPSGSSGQISEDKQSTVDSSEYSLVSFTNLQTLLDWHWDLYRIVEGLFQETETAENAQLLIKELESSVKGLNTLNVGDLDLYLIDLLAWREVDANVDSLDEKSRPSYYMKRVDIHYNNLIDVKCSDRISDDIKSYIDSFFIGDNRLQFLLDQLYDVIFNTTYEKRGMETPIEQLQQSSTFGCNHGFSQQQGLYYVYVHVLATEMKGFATLLHVLTSQWLLDPNLQIDMLNLKSLRKNFEIRVKNYHRLLKDSIESVSRLIYPCNETIDEPRNSFLELEYFSRISIAPYANKQFGCRPCWLYPQSGVDPLRGTTIYNCVRIGATLSICPAERGSHRAFMWIYDVAQKTHYGNPAECAGRMQSITGDRENHIRCGLCACSEDSDKKVSGDISTISLTEQISDICNNMVVTNIKFVTYQNAIHLQIQQTKFSKDVLTHEESSWKELDVVYNCTNKKATTFKYEPLKHTQKTIFLDDIEVPDGYVVTGVRFKFVDNSAFMLELHATSFDIGTAKLDSSKSNWFDATSTNSIRPQYNRPRMEINMNHSDDPRKGDSFAYDPNPNKLITFTHTDMRKDAGQTTIPFLDARSVHVTQLIPLSGIGLYFRGQDGYGGYITPRIYTLDIIPYLETKLKKDTCRVN